MLQIRTIFFKSDKIHFCLARLQVKTAKRKSQDKEGKLFLQWESKLSVKPPNISRDSTINKSFIDNDISRDSDTKIHSRNKSQNVILFKPNILKEIEEDKQENVDFYIKKTRRERQIAELQIKRIAQEQPELLDDKSKEIIRRIDTRNLK